MSFKTCGRGCADGWDVRMCCELNCPAKNSHAMFLACPMRISTFAFALGNDIVMYDRAVKNGFIGVQELCLESGLTQADADEVMELWREDRDNECDGEHEYAAGCCPGRKSELGCYREGERTAAKIFATVVDALAAVSDESIITQNEEFDEAINNVIETTFYNEQKDFFNEGLDTNITRKDFAYALKLHYLYSLIVLSARGDAEEIEKEINAQFILFAEFNEV